MGFSQWGLFCCGTLCNIWFVKFISNYIEFAQLKIFLFQIWMNFRPDLIQLKKTFKNYKAFEGVKVGLINCLWFNISLTIHQTTFKVLILAFLLKFQVFLNNYCSTFWGTSVYNSTNFISIILFHFSIGFYFIFISN